jgi:hypothetical protein
MKTPIDTILDALEYQEAEYTERDAITSEAGILHVTHEAVLKVGDKNLRVYILSDGERVIDAEDLEKFFDA